MHIAQKVPFFVFSRYIPYYNDFCSYSLLKKEKSAQLCGLFFYLKTFQEFNFFPTPILKGYLL